ncbi:MAG: zinc ribbon domain-containing protein [Treponema sp.]|jgi:hypothetical protein|nr:zinc ribbon domain-containing protein [Treponema sp.]
MFCVKCGNEVKDGAKFCAKCGMAVNTATMPNTQSHVETFRSATGELRAGNHEKLDLSALSMVEIAEKQKPATPPPQQTISPSMATQYVPQRRNNMLIAMIALSIATIISSATFIFFVVINHQNGRYFLLNPLAGWFIIILLALALTHGYIYPSSVLKISAFIGLVLKGSELLPYLLYDYLMKILCVINVQYIIFAIIFFVLAIQLLKKNTGNGK